MQPQTPDQASAMIARSPVALWLLGTAAFGAALVLSLADATVGRTARAAPIDALTIFEVAVDSGAGIIDITGENFGFPYVVEVGTLSGAGPGDITEDCALLSSTFISCAPDPFPDDGDYLIHISTGSNTKDNDYFDLTILTTAGRITDHAIASTQVRPVIISNGSIAGVSTGCNSVGLSVALGGGCGSDDSTLQVVRTAPVAGGWECTFSNQSGAVVLGPFLTAYAVCANLGE